MNPVRVAFLTSIRDIGKDEKGGTVVATREGPRYMEGVIERFVTETRTQGALFGYAELAFVVTDDMPKDLQGSPYPTSPESGVPWIHPLTLKVGSGLLVADVTVNIPSVFRALPREATAERAAEKLRFERAVLDAMRMVKADVLISDHYMARVEHLVGSLGLFGKVLNIHPAITLHGHEFAFPGKTPTRDAIARARSGQTVFTGATLHVMDGEIDHGPPVAYMAGTPVYADDEPEYLRYRNYQASKLPLFIGGLRHYIGRIYPHLGSIDLSSLEARKER